MAVTEQMLRNALKIIIEDYTSDPNNISKKELQECRKRFDSFLEQLEEEASEEPDEDDVNPVGEKAR